MAGEAAAATSEPQRKELKFSHQIFLLLLLLLLLLPFFFVVVLFSFLFLNFSFVRILLDCFFVLQKAEGVTKPIAIFKKINQSSMQ